VAAGAITLLTHNVRRCCHCESYGQTRIINNENRLSTTHQTENKQKTRWLQRLMQRIKKTVFVIWRGVEIVVMFSPLIVLAPTAFIVSYTNDICKRLFDRTSNGSIFLTSAYIIDEQSTTDACDMSLHHSNNHDATFASNIAWGYTLFTLQYLGPAFVKLGQWAATRRDLFPVHFCTRLSELHSQANTHDFSHTQNALVKAFGENYESRGLVVNEDDTILGSGSAAQVYKATLHCSKTEKPVAVAVKVLHPNIRLKVERDLALMQHIADFIDRCIPLQSVKMMSLPRAVANFSDIMRRQVDLRIEGENLEVFRKNFGCSTKSSTAVNFPAPQRHWVSEQVLVEEFIGDGAKPISDYLVDDSLSGLKERRALAGTFVRSALKMVFVDNFVHSDLHPGNVFVREEKSNRNETKYMITFIDAGIATSLKPNDRKNLRDLFKAVVLNDGYTAGALMVERARFERCSSIPGGKEKFASGVQDIVSEFHDRRKQGLTLGAVRVGSLLAKVLDLCRVYQVEIDPAMSSIVISMMVLEGLGRSLDPDLNLIKSAIPFLVGKV
jgi:aarF domain-containing kinase